MPSGGYREGAGRKSKAEKYARPVNKAERRIVDRLPELVDNLLALADGGYERVTEHFEPAGMIFVGEGDARTLAFPQLKPDELVIVKRVREYADRDRAANQYLLDRIMGKPTAAVEMSGPEGGPIEVDQIAGLNDDARAERIARLLERARARAAGSVAQPEPDLGAATGPAD